VTDAGYVRRLSAAQYRHLLGRRRSWWLVVLPVCAVVLAAVLPGTQGFVLPVVLTLLVVVGLAGLGLLRTARLAPAGTVIAAALGPEGLHLRGPVVTDGQMRYSAYREVVVRGQFVVLELRAGRGVSVLPLALFPGSLVDELRERVRSAPAPAQPPMAAGRPTATSYTTDDGYTRRLAIAWFRQRVLTPGRLGALGLTAVGAGLLAGAGTGPGTGIVVVAGFLAVLSVLYGHAYRRDRRRLAALVPVGSVYRAELGDDHLWLAGPVMTFEQSYAAFVDVRTRGDFVFLQQLATRRWVVFPAQLFPGGVLRDLRARVVAARPPTAGDRGPGVRG
jgi:sirohydrochlorin ferrochelatase